MRKTPPPPSRGKFVMPEQKSAPLPWVAKRKHRLDENGNPVVKVPRTKKIKKPKTKVTHNHSGQSPVEYEPIRKPHYKARRPKKLTDRQVRNIIKSEKRAIPNLVAMGHEFDMLTGKWKLAPEFGV